MGGDRFNTHHSSIEDEDESSNHHGYLEQAIDSNGHSRDGILHQKVENGSLGAGNYVFDEFGNMGWRSSSTSLASEVNRRRNHSHYRDVLATYDELQPRSESLKEAKNKILSYTPGSRIDKVGGFSIGDYVVPQTTTLLLIGPKGSGKSSLVNKISRSFEHDKFAPERAQVSNGSSVGQGTLFLQEYMIPRGSDSLCLYDTRALCDDSIENMKMLKLWLTRGVQHGELVQRASDDANLSSLSNFIVRKDDHFSSRVRVVNFVVMVVNGISVLESMDSDDEGKKRYTEMIATTFSYPFLSFKDDKPVIVVTHGDLLTLTDRARLRVYLGNLLGVPPKTQIFDIPDGNNKATELAIVDLLSHCLERADRNLPLKADRNCSPKRLFIGKINMLLLLACILLQGIGNIIPYMLGRFVQYPPNPVNKPPDPAPLGINKPSDPSPSGMNKPPDRTPGLNKPPDPAPSTMNKPAPYSDVKKPSDAAPSSVNTPSDPTSSAVNKPPDPSAVNKPAPSGVNKRAAHSGVHMYWHKIRQLSEGLQISWHEIWNLWYDKPSGVNTPSDLVPSAVNKPPDPSAVNVPAPSNVNKHAPPDVNKAGAHSGVHMNWHKTQRLSACFRINWNEIQHLWYDHVRINWHEIRHLCYYHVRISWHKIQHLSAGVRINCHEIWHLWYDHVRMNWPKIRHLCYDHVRKNWHKIRHLLAGVLINCHETWNLCYSYQLS